VANIVAVTISTVPGYFLSKHWVWRHHGSSSVAREALPFWMLNLAGLVLSTIFAYFADRLFEQGWVVNVANIAGFGVLWVAKFFILDEYLFKADPPPLVEI
jgi:putative flippase GtrA